MQDQMPPQNDMNAMPEHGPDREGAMAKADLYKLANYSLKLFKQIQDEDQLEGWVQAKITKAADYIASVYHYLEYEMKFSEYGHHLDNSDTLSEGQKAALKGKLMEAKEKMKELKKKQADKVKGKKEEKIAEEKSSTGGEIDRSKKGVTKHTQNPDRFSDEPHTEPKSQAKAQSAKEKAGDKAADKAEEKEGKNWEKRFGKGSVTRVKDGKKVDEAKDEDKFDPLKHVKNPTKGEKEAAKDVKRGSYADRAAMLKSAEADGRLKEASKPDYIDADGDGDEKESMKKAFADKKKAPFKKVKEALKGDQKKLDADDDGDIEADDLADLRAKKEKKVDEAKAKPSAGMSAKEKSAVAKKASAGKDIGKPGKSFDKVAAKAGGGEKGKKIAAAAMWKNQAKKESVEPTAEVIKESAELNRMKEFLTRLNG